MIPELFQDPTFWTVALGSSLLSGVAGALGVFAVLRRESLIGDVMSHAALPGLVLAFLITGSRELPPESAPSSPCRSPGAPASSRTPPWAWSSPCSSGWGWWG